jgi:hypothetical protein
MPRCEILAHPSERGCWRCHDQEELIHRYSLATKSKERFVHENSTVVSDLSAVRQAALALEDSGGEPLDRLPGQPMKPTAPRSVEVLTLRGDAAGPHS